MSFSVFLKKEIIEAFKTSKLLILGVLFLFFGILSPLTAKYMNELLKIAGQQQGVTIQLPPSTFIQSYEQFFKNNNFMMIIVIILVFAGSVAEEKSRGTAILVLTKCLSRQAFIFGKLISAIMIFTFSYLVSAGICIYYTFLLFPEYMNKGVPYALLLYWLFGLLIITVTVFASVLSRSNTTAAVGGFIFFAFISAIAAIPNIGAYTPGFLQGLAMELVYGSKIPNDAFIPSLVTITSCIAAITAGLYIFKRQEL